MTLPAANAPYEIIADAMLDAGLLQEGDTPNGEQLASGMRRLQDIILLETTQGLKLWLLSDTSVTLVSGQATYTFSPTGNVVMTRPYRVIQGYYLDSSSVRRPLVVLSWDDYIRLSQITQTGAVNSYFVNKQDTQLSVFFWLTPDSTAATGTAHVLLQQQVTQFTSLTDTMNFPPEWRMFLRWALASDLSIGQPPAISGRCDQMAERTRTMLEGWDVEDSPTSLALDQRATYQVGGFR